MTVESKGAPKPQSTAETLEEPSLWKTRYLWSAFVQMLKELAPTAVLLLTDTAFQNSTDYRSWSFSWESVGSFFDAYSEAS